MAGCISKFLNYYEIPTTYRLTMEMNSENLQQDKRKNSSNETNGKHRLELKKTHKQIH